LNLEKLMGHARILLADDHQAILETVTRLLAVDFDVVGAVENGEQAVQAVAKLDPDVVVLDISMPLMNGIEAAARLKNSGSRARVVFLTVQEQPDFVNAAFSTGALGYVVKSHLCTDLVPAIKEVLEGRIFASQSLNVDETAGTRLARDA
jgi:DNA-binding NarL/FixJ family response regulator